ncbi:MAG: hypothetical protein KF824_00145 [Fimbriimonadaceae bacterium]|nr:MAG: hypothetical protein KF824_00145 [Fimbriimonadaceae bacterium]
MNFPRAPFDQVREDRRTFRKSTNKSIWQVYWPLALSWIFMAFEGQIALWMIGQMPNSKLNAAGLGLIMPIAIFIESPVIDLLSTGTTLGTNRQRFAALTRFTLILMAWVTFAHCLIVYTPLYPIFAGQVLEAPANVAYAAWTGLAWMPIWSACVGWRRYLQGLMIRAGKTKPISWGTLVRILAMSGVGLGLYLTHLLSGLALIGAAMLAAVFAEALYIHIVSRQVVAALPDEPEAEPLSLSRLFKFHLPLTGSTVLMLTTPIFLTKAINQSADPVLSLAAWTTAGTLGWLFRTVTFALPEAVISLYQAGREKVILVFCTNIGLALTVAMVAMHLTGFDVIAFREFFKADPGIPERAAFALLIMAPLPLLNAVMGYYRGLLTSHHVTSARMIALAIAIAGILVSLPITISLKLGGIVVAGIALIVAHVLELSTLATCWNFWRKRNPAPLA